MRLSFVLYFSSTNSFFTTFVINIGFKMKVSETIFTAWELQQLMLSATPCEVMLLHGSSSYATSAEVADITSCGVALLFSK